MFHGVLCLNFSVWSLLNLFFNTCLWFCVGSTFVQTQIVLVFCFVYIMFNYAIIQRPSLLQNLVFQYLMLFIEITLFVTLFYWNLVSGYSLLRVNVCFAYFQVHLFLRVLLVELDFVNVPCSEDTISQVLW